MRDLTQEEIDNKPEWATHFVIAQTGRLVYESESLWAFEGGLENDRFDGLPANAKPIPTKTFDITQYEFEDSITEAKAEVSGDNLVLNFPHGAPKWIFFDKDDVAAMAKHFKLI